jgi:hypothetical protein
MEQVKKIQKRLIEKGQEFFDVPAVFMEFSGNREDDPEHI